MPAPVPGREIEQTTSMSIIINKVGIIILEDFSMPFSYSFYDDKMSNQQESHQPCYGDARGYWKNLGKKVMNSLGVLPAKPFVTASKIYSSVHPATTE